MDQKTQFIADLSADTLLVCELCDMYGPLMWAHYRDEHRGVCLLYRFPESFFLDPANEILGTVNVDYKANSLTEWLSGDFSMGMRQFIKELAKVYLRAKAPAGTMKVRYGYFASSKGFSTSTSEC